MKGDYKENLMIAGLILCWIAQAVLTFWTIFRR